MAVFQEDFCRCNECGNKHFVQKELLVINNVASKVSREESQPLPQELLDRKIIYVCSKCGNQLDV